MGDRTYIAIDLKSFYASVECIERGLDPMTTNLVVADESRTQKTICLAVSPSLKSLGIPGRPRLFEVVQKVKYANEKRLQYTKNKTFTHSSYDINELNKLKNAKIDYIIARPQMAHYIDVSAQIYNIYLKWIAPEDIHVYSIDEVFIDATDYLKMYNLTALQFTKKLIMQVLETTGITATAGIGTNLYLCKIAMDILAKHISSGEDDLKIAYLDEMKYRKNLWHHTPITDFWRVGKGYQKRLQNLGLFTMGDVARYSIYNEDALYDTFGINAELLIDHAWGYEPCTIKDIKSYKPENRSMSSGQVLTKPYKFDDARLVIKEMADNLSLMLVDKKLVTDQIVITVGYDNQSLKDPEKIYTGEITEDAYGRKIPKKSHGTENIGRFTSSTKLIMDCTTRLFERIVDKNLLIRRMYVVANHITREDKVPEKKVIEQLNLFTDYKEEDKKRQKEETLLKKEKKIQKALITVKKKYGKNAILKGMNLIEGATAKDRNRQIGGHRS